MDIYFLHSQLLKKLQRPQCSIPFVGRFSVNKNSRSGLCHQRALDIGISAFKNFKEFVDSIEINLEFSTLFIIVMDHALCQEGGASGPYMDDSLLSVPTRILFWDYKQNFGD